MKHMEVVDRYLMRVREKYAGQEYEYQKRLGSVHAHLRTIVSELEACFPDAYESISKYLSERPFI